MKSRNGWSRIEPPYKLQILQELHANLLNKVERCMELHETAWSHREALCKVQILQEPHGDFLNAAPCSSMQLMQLHIQGVKKVPNRFLNLM